MFDQVCGMDLDKATPHKASYKGHSFYFCSKTCQRVFRDETGKYADGQPLIKMEKVWKVYRLGKIDVPVLRGLSMRVYPGEMVALVGPSGSGKSTALNVIGTLDIPSQGKYNLFGKDVMAMGDDELAKLRSQKIGFVFQQFNLIPSLTAIENVMLPELLAGRDAKVSRAKALDLLKSVGLGERGTHRPMELSGGEQQRVAIARAFINDPDIILADEPTGNLDSTTSVRVIDLLVDLWKKRKKTIIIVTHDPHVASHAQRIVSFHDGKLTPNHGVAKGSIWQEEAHK